MSILIIPPQCSNGEFMCSNYVSNLKFVVPTVKSYGILTRDEPDFGSGSDPARF